MCPLIHANVLVMFWRVPMCQLVLLHNRGLHLPPGDNARLGVLFLTASAGNVIVITILFLPVSSSVLLALTLLADFYRFS